MIKPIWIDFVVVISKLYVSERSTAPYFLSTSKPPADRTTLVKRSQQLAMASEACKEGKGVVISSGKTSPLFQRFISSYYSK
jgi:hypothetical protein